jgi:hypothetical protein
MVSRNRGVKKPKLRDLSEEPLTLEEQDALVDAIIAKTPPIVAAILGAVLVEHELETSLRRRLSRKDDKTWLDMLDERGPYSTFSRKITAAHAMRIIDDAFLTNLDIIRTIRNAFAHSKRVIDFNHPLVIAQLKKIAVPSFKKKRFRELQRSDDGLTTYRSLCILSTTWLIERRNTSMRASLRRQRKPKNYLSFYNALSPSLTPGGTIPPSALKSNRQLSPSDQTGGPSSPALGGLLDGLLPYLEARKGKTGK